jgi:hypothetical protein
MNTQTLDNFEYKPEEEYFKPGTFCEYKNYQALMKHQIYRFYSGEVTERDCITICEGYYFQGSQEAKLFHKAIRDKLIERYGKIRLVIATFDIDLIKAEVRMMLALIASQMCKYVCDNEAIPINIISEHEFNITSYKEMGEDVTEMIYMRDVIFKAGKIDINNIELSDVCLSKYEY